MSIVSKICPFCGPKLSVCCVVMSIWGILFLGILGILFFVKSATLFEDLKYEKTGDDWKLEEVDHEFYVVAINCWIATAMYVVVLGISSCQLMMNIRNAARKDD